MQGLGKGVCGVYVEPRHAHWPEPSILECWGIENHLAQLSSKWVTQTAQGTGVGRLPRRCTGVESSIRPSLQVLSLRGVMCLGQCLESAGWTLLSCPSVTHLPCHSL